MRKFFRQHWNLLVAAALVGVWAFLTHNGFSRRHDELSRVTLLRTDWHQVEIGGKPVLYYKEVADGDSLMRSLSETRERAAGQTVAQGRWANRHWWLPVSRGTLVADIDSLDAPVIDAKPLISANLARIERRLHDLDTMALEMDYYFSVHDVSDDGYMLVTEYYERAMREEKRLIGVRNRLRECLSADSLTITHRATYKAEWKVRAAEATDSTASETCMFDGKRFRLVSHRTPSEARPISFLDTLGLGLTFRRIAVPKRAEPVLNGFALRVTPEKGVQVGEWKDGKFLGERVSHNSNRIYGIDISRHQHEKGRRRYNIDWDRMRITSLGKKGNRNVSDTVDYPVSFCYIKSTEGTTIRNRYFPADYAAAKKRAIYVGAYHFLSCKATGQRQAQWFLKNTKYQQGDLPPVLDIEPTDAQIRAAGGTDGLFRMVREWLNTVEKRLGVKPILYVNQRFVDKYLPLAPDLKRDYEIWIARYGEFKPDVHLVYWQLSSDGRVEGIRTAVDINVFNGYSAMFGKYLQERAKP